MRPFEIKKIEPFDTAFLITPLLAEDERGYVLKNYHQPTFENHGINHPLTEVFYTSSKKGVMRAIHFQVVKPQGKLVRCVCGKIYDVIVDLRVDSPTYKQWKSFILTEDSPQILVPHGFGHGYLVLEDSVVSYQCDEIFYGEYDTGILWDDPELAIKWPLEQVDSLILSQKDKELQSLNSYEKTAEKFTIVGK